MGHFCIIFRSLIIVELSRGKNHTRYPTGCEHVYNWNFFAEHSEIIGMDDRENSNIPIVDLDKDCIGTLCLRKVTIASTLNTITAVCDIQWKDSTLSRLDNTSVEIQNFTELLSLRKVEERFNLEV